LTEDLEKNAAKDKKKAAKDKMKGGVKQNQTRKGKQKTTKEPIGKRKRASTLSSSDSDDDFEEPILVESDEGSDDDTECPYCKEIFSTNAEKMDHLYHMSPVVSRRVLGSGRLQEICLLVLLR
jgi:hypothetical protein